MKDKNPDKETEAKFQETSPPEMDFFRVEGLRAAVRLAAAAISVERPWYQQLDFLDQEGSKLQISDWVTMTAEQFANYLKTGK